MHTPPTPPKPTSRPATLTHDLHTPLGIYTAGLPIRTLTTHKNTTLICLDNGYHPTGTCHTTHLTKTQYTHTQNR